MSEQEKKEKIMKFLNDKVFALELEYAEQNNDKKIKNTVSQTIRKFEEKVSAKDMAIYFSELISCGTTHSQDFSSYLKKRNVIRLEDVAIDFFKVFNEDWLNQ